MPLLVVLTLREVISLFYPNGFPFCVAFGDVPMFGFCFGFIYSEALAIVSS